MNRTPVGTSAQFQWGHTYSYDNNANRTGGSITANGASMAFTSGVLGGTNRQSNAAGITVTTNAAGDITSLLGKTMAYDSAGQLAEATAIPPCPSGQNCSGAQTTSWDAERLLPGRVRQVAVMIRSVVQ